MAETVIDYPRGLTFEKVWAALMENREQQKESALEFDRRMKESRLEFDQQMKKSRLEFDQEMKESRKETDRIMKETDRRMKKTEEFLESIGKQMGGLHKSFGELAEHLVLPGIIERFNRLGYHFNAVFSRGMKIYDDNKKMLTEVDMMLMNGDCLMAVEVKATVVFKDIQHHVRRMEILRDYYNRLNDKRKLYGTIAGAMFEDAAAEALIKEAAIEAGFYVIEQTGDTMRMAVPEGFVPREW